MKTKIITFFTIIIFFSCKEATGDLITFNVPQPEGKNNLKEFPSKIIGVYKNYDTEEKITICKNLIYSIKLIKDRVPNSLKDSLKSEKLFNTY